MAGAARMPSGDRWRPSWHTSGWIGERHSVHLQAVNGTVEHIELEQKPAVLDDWVAHRQQRLAGGKIAVALEQRKGAVIHALLMDDCLGARVLRPATGPRQ